MAANGWGRYIGISTECVIQAFETQSAYVAGKRGMDGVLRVLAKEVGPSGVTVNQVAPGWTVSDRDRAARTEDRPEYSAKVPLRRRGTDQEVANGAAANWLAAEGALVAAASRVFALLEQHAELSAQEPVAGCI
jgi:3-oxoacyl-[acyl-carrier protein] reductase